MKYSILKKYFEDKSSKEEMRMVTDWLEGAEFDQKSKKYIHLLWDEFNPEDLSSDINYEAILDKIYHNVQLRKKPQKNLRIVSPKSKSNVSFNHIMKYFSRIAAILLVPLFLYISWEIYTQKMWIKNQSAVVYNEIKAPLGAQSSFELPDGTTGNLNNGSILRYPVKFTGKIREVDLQGEAYFDVKHVRGRPFIINTAGLDVKVLGTKLNVYSYPDEDYQEVTLESGVVELVKRENEQETTVLKMHPNQHVLYEFNAHKSKADQPGRQDKLVVLRDAKQLEKIMPRLKPDQKAYLNMDDGDLYLQNVKTQQYTGWRKGKLILKNDPMPVLLKRMERWYSVKFNIKDDRINEYTYWATFEEENLEQVLRLLSLTGPLKFTLLPREKNEDGTLKPQKIDVTIDFK